QRLFEQVGARLERPRELRFLAGDRTEDGGLVLGQVWVERGPRRDDDLRRLCEERLRSPEQPSVTDRAPDDPAADVAAALVGRRHAIADQERDRAGVIGDDLVAEALGLELVRIMPEQLAHALVDRRE